MSSACNHTDNEHDGIAKEIQERVRQGDLTALLPLVDNEMLNKTLQAAAIEIFIRSRDWTAARQNWEVLDDLVRSTFFVDRPEESAYPEEYTHVKNLNTSYMQVVDLSQAGNELDEIIDQHGVAEPVRPTRQNDDFPGFYL